MPKPPDLETLARRYLDLWQDHLGALAGDPGVAEVMARTLELMNAGSAAFATLATQAAAGAHDTTEPPVSVSAGSRTRTKAAAAAPRAADPALAELARRVAILEQRLAELEARGRGRCPGPDKRPRRRRS
jgi:hypothetical protein